MGSVEERSGKESMKLHSEKQACPRRRKPRVVKTI
jgi:hypothetical protein